MLIIACEILNILSDQLFVKVIVLNFTLFIEYINFSCNPYILFFHILSRILRKIIFCVQHYMYNIIHSSSMVMCRVIFYNSYWFVSQISPRFENNLSKWKNKRFLKKCFLIISFPVFHNTNNDNKLISNAVIYPSSFMYFVWIKLVRNILTVSYV